MEFCHWCCEILPSDVIAGLFTSLHYMSAVPDHLCNITDYCTGDSHDHPENVTGIGDKYFRDRLGVVPGWRVI